MRKEVVTALRSSHTVRKLWGRYRVDQLLTRYRERREHYHRLATARGLVYDEAGSQTDVRARFRTRGWDVRPKAAGDVHTFAFIPRIGWHYALYPALHELGRVSEYDYAAHGYTLEEFWRLDPEAARRRRRMNEEALAAIAEAHRRDPLDWVFVYASGLEIERSFIERITGEIGVPVVNMCLDDKQSWTGPKFGDQHLGQVDIASAFDLSWTSARVACEWYLVEGARPVYLPEGFEPAIYRPMEVPRDIPVSFIGGAYGFRPEVVRHLQRNGVPVTLFGDGWGTRSVWGDEQVEVINRSVINLGMGGIGYSEALTNVKTRDFEIPGAGGGLYLTSYNCDLAQHFEVGREIACYRTLDEMIELIRHYLARPEEAHAVARRGRERCLREHRWIDRYRRLCEIIGILSPS